MNLCYDICVLICEYILNKNECILFLEAHNENYLKYAHIFNAYCILSGETKEEQNYFKFLKSNIKTNKKKKKSLLQLYQLDDYNNKILCTGSQHQILNQITKIRKLIGVTDISLLHDKPHLLSVNFYYKINEPLWLPLTVTEISLSCCVVTYSKLPNFNFPNSLTSITFNKNVYFLKKICFPPQLKCLIFKNELQHSIDINVLPSHLEELRIHDFNSVIHIGALPTSLKILILGKNFNFSNCADILPASLLHLEVGFMEQNHFKMLPQSLTHLRIESKTQNNKINKNNLKIDLDLNHEMYPFSHLIHLKYLYYGGHIDYKLKSKMIPKSIETLFLSYSHQLQQHIFPHMLTNLTLGDNFNCVIQKNVLPATLISLIFGEQFNKPLDEDVLPSSLEFLSFGNFFDQEIKKKYVPSKLQTLLFGYHFNNNNKKFETNVFPKTLTKLIFGDLFNQSLDGILPKSLKHITFGKYYNQQITSLTLGDTCLETIIFDFNFDQKSLITEIMIPRSVMKIMIKHSLCNYSLYNYYFYRGENYNNYTPSYKFYNLEYSRDGYIMFTNEKIINDSKKKNRYIKKILLSNHSEI
jgi:hypothetical protein